MYLSLWWSWNTRLVLHGTVAAAGSVNKFLGRLYYHRIHIKYCCIARLKESDSPPSGTPRKIDRVMASWSWPILHSLLHPCSPHNCSYKETLKTNVITETEKNKMPELSQQLRSKYRRAEKVRIIFLS